MTYPPQPPDPYGQQSQSGFPTPQDGYPQQPGGYPQRGYYQQPQPQQPWGQSQQFPSQYHGQQQPGFGPPQPVMRKRTGLIVGLAMAVVLVLAGAGAGAYFLFFRGGAQSDPLTTGHAVIDALNRKDEAAVLALTCDPYRPTLKTALDLPGSIISPSTSLTFSFQSIQIAGDRATVMMHYQGTVGGRQATSDDKIALQKNASSGNWAVCPQKKNSN